MGTSLFHLDLILIFALFCSVLFCFYVGMIRHGLSNDFETANIFVPPEQVRDTVDLWRLPDRRRISLKFLAAYVLNADIQDEVHDSIEDAKTALLLYKKYLELKEQGEDVLHAKLVELYSLGQQNNWTVGVEKLQ